MSGAFKVFRALLWVGLLGLVATGGLFYYQLSRLLTAADNGLVATISFEQLDRQRYQATLMYPDERVFRAPIYGNFWMLDARFISLKGPLRLLGTEPFYALERLSGRYARVAEEREGIRSVYDLSSADSGVVPDLWQLSVDYDLPWVDARYGVSVYMPMNQGASYAILLGDDGFKAKPLNGPALDAMQKWH